MLSFFIFKTSGVVVLPQARHASIRAIKSRGS
jgi:hypothetical protein